MRNALENSKVFTIPMRVAQPFQVDNGVSDGLHPSVTLGIAKVSTPAIKSQREYMRKALAVKPYHEVMYSFDTIYGRTVSMEQIFASGYPLAVAGALSNMYYHERSPIVAQLMKLIEQELEDSGALEPEKPQRRASRVVEVVETGAWAPSTPRDSRPRASTDTGDDDGMGMSKYAEEQKNKALSAVDDVNLIMLEGLREVRDHCVLVNSGGDIPNRVLSIEEGGLNLRRSVMRFTPKWQFFTTNLNVHMMSSQTLPFAAFKNGEDASVLFGKDQPYEECYDVGCSGIPGKDSEAAAATMAESGTSSPKVARTPTRNSGDSEESKTTTPNNFNVFGVNPGAWKGSRATHLVPTLTLGCPAAHCLKFEDGGLRRMFKGMSDFNRLMWMQALQSNLPTQSLVSMFQEYPEESHALFGNLATTEMLCTTSGLAKVTRRRYQLAYRIDMCGSQALGFALTAVRMSVVQATNFGHSCWEALARSLKIGFFMCFQSMLSTKGDELGMLEDLEVAALWLSLVSLRLVIDPSLDVPENTSEAAKGMKASIGVVGDLPGTPLNNSKTVPPPPIKLRRDLNGRIIADLYVSAKEANTIRACLASIAEYEIPTYSVYKEPPKKARNLNTDAKSTKVGSVPGGFDAADFQIGGPTNTRNEDENDAKKALRFSTTPSVLYEPNEQEPKVLAVLPICAVVFTQGVNEMQTIANMTSSSDVNHQVQINQEALKRVKEFHAHYRSILYTQLEMKETMLKEKQEAAKALEAKNQAKGHNAVMSANGLNTTAPRGKGNAGARVSTLAKTFGGMKKAEDGASKGGMMSTLSKTFGRRTNLAKTERKIEAPPAPSPAAVAMANSARALEELISAVRFSAQTPSDKHCHVLLAISRLTREMGGSVGILCKSGKDRTSQGVTLEIARGLVEDLGVTGGMDKCHSLRTFGTRRMNVYANTGQSMYAFNSLQRLALPTCYRPPANTCSGKVNS
jgi:inositol polyphosphate-4-phosphatase